MYFQIQGGSMHQTQEELRANIKRYLELQKLTSTLERTVTQEWEKVLVYNRLLNTHLSTNRVTFPSDSVPKK